MTVCCVLLLDAACAAGVLHSMFTGVLWCLRAQGDAAEEMGMYDEVSRSECVHVRCMQKVHVLD